MPSGLRVKYDSVWKRVSRLWIPGACCMRSDPLVSRDRSMEKWKYIWCGVRPWFSLTSVATRMSAAPQSKPTNERLLKSLNRAVELRGRRP
jgi:hypothetical protein